MKGFFWVQFCEVVVGLAINPGEEYEPKQKKVG
jgi:hypothetical protein